MLRSAVTPAFAIMHDAASAEGDISVAAEARHASSLLAVLARRVIQRRLLPRLLCLYIR